MILDNMVFDVVIGLVFIYLLYSLLVTVVAEVIATKLGLRARNLREAVNRMLNDEQPSGFFYRLWDSLKIMKSPNNSIINNFYSHPEIRYLGSSGLFSTPSSFKAVSFSKTLLFLLNGSGQLDPQKIDDELRSVSPRVLGIETAQYVLGIWEDSERNPVKFKLQLEAWFDRTMEQASEWYKRKIQIVLLILGFLVAWVFNADTIAIVQKLSKDKTGREQVVRLASAFIESHPAKAKDVAGLLDSASARSYKESIDSLLSLRGRLETDIARSQSFIGSGSWLPDSVYVTTEKITGSRVYMPAIEASLIQNSKAFDEGYICFSNADKRTYLFNVLAAHWPGFVLTALAISLGAPFWFDLLNKVMRLRTSVKQASISTNTNTDNTVLPSNSN